MNLKELVLAKIQKQKQIKAAEIIKQTGFSRNYVNRAMKALRDEGKVILLGKSNSAVYVLADIISVMNAKKKILDFNGTFENVGLREDDILEKIKKETGVFFDLEQNIDGIVSYCFLEMLNNAIEHSQSDFVKVVMKRSKNSLKFFINDAGNGIYNNIKEKLNLPDISSAMLTLLKGKQTTDPERHTGHGIFFASKMADAMTIESGKKRIRWLNDGLSDVFIEDIKKEHRGTSVIFNISLYSRRMAKEIFDKYTDLNSFEFNKTQIKVSLFQFGHNLISRSEARRILLGLDKFEEIILDFKDVETAGQGFADEVFRVWQNKYQNKIVGYINANDNIEFMIKLAKGSN